MAETSTDNFINNSKKLKLFNKMYKEFQVNLLKSLKKANEKIYSVKRFEQITEFCKQIDSKKNIYENKDDSLFKEVSLLNRIFFKRPKLNSMNTAIAWKYIEILYKLSGGSVEEKSEKDQLIDEVNKNVPKDFLKSFGISGDQMSGMVSELVNSKNEGLQNLVKDISSQFSQVDKNIDPSELLKALTNPGKENSLGIDFKKIIENTSKKITSGEIDISSIKEKLLQTKSSN